MEKTVVLSAGHSLTDPGAICPWDRNITEAKLTMAITKKAAEVLRKHSIAVLEVPDDLDLQPTINWINSRPNNIDLAVEIHINSFSDESANGIEGWYYQKDETSKKLSQWIVDGIMAETGLSIRGVKDETTNRWGILGFIHYTKPLACLIECGFITNKNDMKVLADPDGQYAVSKGIARGILGFMGLKWQPELLDPEKPAEPEKPSDPVKDALLEQVKKELNEEKEKNKILVQKQQKALVSMKEYKNVIDLLGASINKTITELES